MEENTVMWAETDDEIRHLSKINNDFINADGGNFYKITDTNDTSYIGTITRESLGNNAGENGHWKYYGWLELLLESGEKKSFNYLNIKEIENVTTPEIVANFDNLGLIKIVKGPWESEKKEAFFKAKGISRFKYMDKFSLVVSILGVIISIIALIFLLSRQLPPGNIVPAAYGLSISITSNAYAETGEQDVSSSNADHSQNVQNKRFDDKVIINLVIISVLIFSFLVCLLVMLFGSDQGKIKRADDFAKMLLGFLIGSGKSYLGI